MFKANMSKLIKNSSKKATKSSFGWDDEEQQRRRLMAFVKNIQVSGKGITTGAVDMINEFKINVDTFDYEELTFELTRICTNENISTDLDHKVTELENHIKIAYRVDEPGRYRLDIKYQGITIQCSPFAIEIQKCKVAKANDVIAFGKGLRRCMAGKVNRFHLDLRKSGQGSLSVIASTENMKKDAPLYTVTESKHGYQVHYVTSTNQPFFFHIKLNGKHITGSPFLVTDERKEGILENAKMLFRLHAKNHKRLCHLYDYNAGLIHPTA